MTFFLKTLLIYRTLDLSQEPKVAHYFFYLPEFGYYGAYSAYLDPGTFSSKDWGSRRDGMSVRFIMNKN